MVSRNESEAASGLRDLIGRLITRRVLNWSSSSETVTDRPKASDLSRANIVTSRHDTDQASHAVVLDIDHPAWLVKSTTPGHFHLYIDVPGGIPQYKYLLLLRSLASAGVIEDGYLGASLHRGYSSVRLPWIKKEKD